MNHRTKTILIKSLADFKARDKDSKKKAIGFVKTELDRHERGLYTIGMGLDTDMVRAGKIFLRIYKEKVK